jgi:hypothetical protein
VNQIDAAPVAPSDRPDPERGPGAWEMPTDRQQHPLEDGTRVFPAPLRGWRHPSNTPADLRGAFAAAGFDWVTSHVFR